MVRHRDALDLVEMFKSVAPGLIHHIDSLILRHAFADAPFDVAVIHDAAGCHPNHFDDMCCRYRHGFLKATEGDLLQSIADQWNVEQRVEVGTDRSWRDGVMDAVYLFN